MVLSVCFFFGFDFVMEMRVLSVCRLVPFSWTIIRAGMGIACPYSHHII